MTTTPQTRYLTLHVLSALPWHNLNRDERGMPKTLTQGGVSRAMLSSQSLKRAARLAYEQSVSDASYRSAGHAHQLVADRVAAIAVRDGKPVPDPDKTSKAAREAVSLLVKKAAAEGAETRADKDTNVWLSEDEIDLLAHAVLAETSAKDAAKQVGDGGATASLAIAAFGRMFAASPHQQTVAAIAVSPATTTHAMIFETDYFTVVDDLNELYAEAAAAKGASFLDSAHYTSGVYYRAITIDRDQLRRSWSSFADPAAAGRVRALVRSLVLALPSGKAASSAPYTKPLLVLAEEQTTRTAYEFDTPVTPDTDGGYKRRSVEALIAQRADALAFDPAGFGPATAAGTQIAQLTFDENVTTGNLDTVVDHVERWLFR
ncbi:MAG: type I-E CRISPR-associated protein Cas7/Cse4/CasC [Cellulomonadaceae bacterium]|nr:type I-E CRISPR-associated protein Cas7/Cse4/CasC [Cellulomonadaceae bacterium]